MSPLIRDVKGVSPKIVLPVTLSPAVRRDLLLRTGKQPDPRQVFFVLDLTELEQEERVRLVDLWEQINVRWTDVHSPEFSGWWDEIEDPRNDGYRHLQRVGERWTRYLPGPDGDSIDVNSSFYAAAGRTVTALDVLREELDENGQDELQAMLDGAPLVSDVGESTGLELEHVLAAYEATLPLAARLIELTDNGVYPGLMLLLLSHEVTDEAVFVAPSPHGDSPDRLVAVLKAADPNAYAAAARLLEQLVEVAAGAVAEKLDRACFHWWSSRYADADDAKKVEDLLAVSVRNALSDHATEMKTQEEADRYENCRSKWIVKHGSSRLKRAAERGYKHDGIYRDERLSVELPDFVGSLGRKPNVRELVNPSEQALEIEAEVLARTEALGIDDVQVRLVYARPDQDSDWYDGEFVQIQGYLGRHTIWRSVSGESATSDVPF